jgi:hypothetical protein
MKHLKTCILLFLFFANNLSAITRYVTVNGAGSMNGASWANAFPGTSLQTAIDQSAPADEVWVAQGTYYPTTTGDRSASFSMKSGVYICGGFNGTETSFQQRNLATTPHSILSGNIGTPSHTDNSYHVIFNNSLNNAVLDGFTIEDGMATGTPGTFDEGGAGIYNYGGFGTASIVYVRYCIFRNNRATYGAAVFNHGSNSGSVDSFFAFCVFENDSALAGGAIDNYAYAGSATQSIVGSLFVNNKAAHTGGAIHCWGGGGGYVSLNVSGSTFYGNTAGTGGGAIVADTHNNGSGASGNSDIFLEGSILYGNTAPAGPQFYTIGTGTVQSAFSDIDLSGQAAPHVLSGSTAGTISVPPLFTNSIDPDGADNTFRTSDDGFTLTAASPCIDAGMASAVTITDLKFEPRIVNTIDMGAYEFQGGVGIPDSGVQNDVFKVFPNPTQDALFVSTSKNICDFHIYNLSGAERKLKSNKEGEHMRFDLTTLEQGIYMLLLICEDGTVLRKTVSKIANN